VVALGKRRRLRRNGQPGSGGKVLGPKLRKAASSRGKGKDAGASAKEVIDYKRRACRKRGGKQMTGRTNGVPLFMIERSIKEK